MSWRTDIVTIGQAQLLLARISEKIPAGCDPDQAAELSLKILTDELEHFGWAGVYWKQGDQLVLGPYQGDEPIHQRIPIGSGICGLAVRAGENQIVPDVSVAGEYLACDPKTRSEIVVLIRDLDDGDILGQIDIDGFSAGAFDRTDEALLEAVAVILAGTFAGSPSR